MKETTHKDQISSLRRIEGQVKGIQSMIEDDKYCIDILNQNIIDKKINRIKNPLIHTT